VKNGASGGAKSEPQSPTKILENLRIKQCDQLQNRKMRNFITSGAVQRHPHNWEHSEGQNGACSGVDKG